jgi:hypothetical protein
MGNMYADVIAAIDSLWVPTRKLSTLYEAGGGALDDAVHVDSVSGETRVDRDGFRSTAWHQRSFGLGVRGAVC